MPHLVAYIKDAEPIPSPDANLVVCTLETGESQHAQVSQIVRAASQQTGKTEVHATKTFRQMVASFKELTEHVQSGNPTQAQTVRPLQKAAVEEAHGVPVMSQDSFSVSQTLLLPTYEASAHAAGLYVSAVSPLAVQVAAAQVLVPSQQEPPVLQVLPAC